MNQQRDYVIRKREEIYDEMCKLLTEYEDGSDMVTEYELYDMLVKIQNHWEDVITAEV